MVLDQKVLVGVGDAPVYLLPRMANRHGLIAGATGTGKTTTLKVLAEGMSNLGVPVFLADVKGDVSSLCLSGEKTQKILDRLDNMGISEHAFVGKSFPCRFWDVFGEKGIPVRATVSDVGPMLLSRLMELTEVQAGVLNIVFHVADDLGWALLDLKDLQAMIKFIGDNRGQITLQYGNVTPQSLGAIQRALLRMQDQGAALFLGEPELNVSHWLETAGDGRGIINVLDCVKLSQQPLMYSMYLLWMLSTLYETLPEVGDQDKPRLVFFFDEAHMLFSNAPKSLLEKITQIVKLVRSKGVGVYFITQSPSDIPDSVLAQLNNRIQHALRAYTPKEQKAVRAAAETFRANPSFDTATAINELATGEALVSMLDEKGVPTIVERTTICPPQSSFTPLEDAARAMLLCQDKYYQLYKDAIDNISAYEKICELYSAQEAEEAAAAEALAAELEAKQAAKEEAEAAKAEAAAQKAAEKEAKEIAKAEAAAAKAEAAAQKAAEKAEKEALKAQQAQYKAEGKDKYGRTPLQASVEKAAKSAVKTEARTIGRQMGKSITRGVLGTSNKTANRLAGNVVGSLMSDLAGSFFKR